MGLLRKRDNFFFSIYQWPTHINKLSLPRLASKFALSPETFSRAYLKHVLFTLTSCTVILSRFAFAFVCVSVRAHVHVILAVLQSFPSTLQHLPPFSDVLPFV